MSLQTKIGKDRVSTIEAKMNELALEMRKRDDYIKNILSMPCHRYAFSIEGYASIHTEHTLEERLSALRHNMSDATLKQVRNWRGGGLFLHPAFLASVVVNLEECVVARLQP